MGEEHAYGGDAGTRALSLSHTCGGHTGRAATLWSSKFGGCAFTRNRTRLARAPGVYIYSDDGSRSRFGKKKLEKRKKKAGPGPSLPIGSDSLRNGSGARMRWFQSE